MYYTVRTDKTVADAARDLAAAIGQHGFGVLYIHDLAETLARKGYPLGAECSLRSVQPAARRQRPAA